MALSLDDKLLGEKTHYYCSSSEDEGDDEEDSAGSDREAGKSRSSKGATFIPEPQIKEYDGRCTNTGPKGVINDWREFKRLETEKREEQEREKQALIKKLTMTCRSHLDDVKEKQKDDEFLDEIGQELDEFEDEFMQEYRKKRIEEMRQMLSNVPKFGYLISLTADEYVEAIDKENPQVTVVVHIYEDRVPACEAMTGSLKCLAQEYPSIKFCQLKASESRLSKQFSKEGVPALLIYKQGELIGNFIRMSDEFGEDFFATDVESFLQEHSFLPSNDVAHGGIHDKKTGEIRRTLPEDEDSGSDFEVD